MAVSGGIPNLKLYFMIGLPFETMDDIEAIITLVIKIKQVFLNASRPLKRIGTITISLNPFIPKPVTPFQWADFEAPSTLKKKIKLIKKGLKGIPNLRLHIDSIRSALIQAILSRGGRPTTDLLMSAHQQGWPQALKTGPQIFTAWDFNKPKPWDFIDHGIKKDYLIKEYKKAQKATVSSGCKPGCNLCGVC